MKTHEIFETNPNLKEVHMTSDGQSFYNDSDAKNHAKTLKDKTVELVVNVNLIEVIIEDNDGEEFETTEQTGEAIKEVMTGIPANADGSVNTLVEEETQEEETTQVEEIKEELKKVTPKKGK